MPPPTTINISSTSGGLVSDPGEGENSFPQGVQTAIIAIPDINSNYEFVNWTGQAVDEGWVVDITAASTTLNPLSSGTYTLIANFALIVGAIKVEGSINSEGRMDVDIGDDSRLTGTIAIDVRIDGEITNTNRIKGSVSVEPRQSGTLEVDQL